MFTDSLISVKGIASPGVLVSFDTKRCLFLIDNGIGKIELTPKDIDRIARVSQIWEYAKEKVWKTWQEDPRFQDEYGDTPKITDRELYDIAKEMVSYVEAFGPDHEESTLLQFLTTYREKRNETEQEMDKKEEFE